MGTWSRNIIVGDTHGCLTELLELLDAVNYQEGLDRLVFVGDLIDRGPDPLGVLRLARESCAESVRGNHENSLLESRKPGSKISNSLYNRDPDFASKLNSEDWKFLESLPFKIQINENIWVVHAGAEPATPFKDQHSEVLSRVRYVGQDGKFKRGSEWYYKPTDGYLWSDGWIGDECIIYGHQTTGNDEPNFKIVDGSNGWTLGIDTGCAYGGRLTAVVIETSDLTGVNMEFSQVKAHRRNPVDYGYGKGYKQTSGKKYSSDFDYDAWNNEQLKLWK
jgi:hypothetical protein